MPLSSGPNTVSDSSIVFNYDIGDLANSYRGQPITNQFQVQGTSGLGAAADNAVNFAIQGTPGFVRLGFNQTFGGYTIQPNDVVYRYPLNSAINGCHYHGNAVSIPAGAFATFTFDYYISPDTDFSTGNNILLANFENYGGGALSGGVNMPNYNKDVWQTVSFTSGPAGGGGGTQAMFLYPGSCGGNIATNGFILYRNPRVYWLPYDVPFVQGTRSTTQALLDISGRGNTINLVNMTYGANNAISFDGTDDSMNLSTNIQSGLTAATYEFVCRPSSLPGTGNYFQLYIQENSTWIALYNVGGGAFFGIDLNNGSGWFDNNGGSTTGARTTTTLSANTWYHVVFSWSSGVVRCYLNGVLQSTVSTAQAPNGRQNVMTLGAGTTPRNIGSRGGGNYWIGQLPIVKFYDKGLSATEVLNNYTEYKTRFNLP